MPQHHVVVAAAFFFIRAPRRQAAGHVHAAGGGDFDLPRSAQPAEEPAGLDFAGMQHGRFRAQVVADHGQGFVHGRGSVGFEFHGGEGLGLGLVRVGFEISDLRFVSDFDFGFRISLIFLAYFASETIAMASIFVSRVISL